MKSFSLLRTNVGLSGNVKLVTDSNSSIYIESINSDPILSNSRYKKIPISNGEYWNESLGKIFKNYPSDLIFKINYSNDNSVMFSDFENQIDTLYLSGCESISQNKEYSEEYEAFAPLWIEKDSVPRGFVIFRVDGPGNEEVTRENFFDKILSKLKFVKLWDFSGDTPIGRFLSLNYEDNPNFPISSLRIDFRQNEFSYWTGVNTTSGLWESRGVILTQFLNQENPFFDIQKRIMDYYKEFGLIHPNILNISFLFDDTPADKNSLRKWSINRYYGFYLEDIILEKKVSFYEPLIINGDTIIGQGNLLFTESGQSPFVEDWRAGDTTWIQVGGVFYKVVRTSTVNTWQVISDLDLSGTTSSGINSDIWTITGDNLLKIKDFRNPCDIINNLRDVEIPNFQTSDVWAIKIGDSLYRVKYSTQDGYSILSDGGFRIYPDRIEYFYNFPEKDTIFKTSTISSDGRPVEFEIYSLKFLDIKDFDNDIIDTKFSHYQYELNNQLNRSSDERKFFFPDYTDTNNPKDFERFDLNGEVNYIPSSSEYTSGWETFRVENNELTPLWRKNPIFVKWGFKNSNSTNDYPYLLNNSLLVSQSNNGPNTFELNPSREFKNLDWFYSRNISSVTYSFQSLHTSTLKYSFFKLEDYFTTSSDYFTDYFGQEIESDSGKTIQSSRKWSSFNSGNSSFANITLFGGIKFGMFKVDSIDVGSLNINTLNLSTNNDFDDWKFSILVDRPEFSYFRVEKCLDDCIDPEPSKIIKLSLFDVPSDIISGTYGVVKDLFSCWRIVEPVFDTLENFTFSGGIIPNICDYCKPNEWLLHPCTNCGTSSLTPRNYLIPSYVPVENGTGLVDSDICYEFIQSSTSSECGDISYISVTEIQRLEDSICNYCQENFIGQCSTTTTTTSTTTEEPTTSTTTEEPTTSTTTEEPTTSTTTEEPTTSTTTEEPTTSTTTEEPTTSTTTEEPTTSTTTEEPTTSTTTVIVTPGFTSSFILSTSPRFIPDQSNIGGWNVVSDFASEILRDVSNNPLNQHIFTTPTFSYGSSSSTVNVSIYDSDAIFMGGLTISLDSDGVQSGSGFSVLREGFSVEGSGWIIRLSGNVTLPDILPQGGRFRTHITHTDGVLSSTNISSDYFWDNDGTQSSINTSQLPQLSSSNNAVVTYSGIQYYTTGNIFRMSLGGINLLNDQTIPTSRQISIQSNNLPVLVSQFNGFADGSKPSLGSGIQGWELTSTSSGCTFAATSSMSVISGDFYPGFNGLTNSISFPSNINISANLYDWGTALSLNSINYDLLIDTYSSSSPANPLYNPIDGEYNRFTITGRTLSGYTSFTSSISLTTLQGELQYIFGRIIYPQHNFSGILPVSGDYTGLGGGTFTFSVYTELDTESKIVETFSDYRWYVSKYQRVDSNTFTNGIFTFDSNWSETDLESLDLVVILRISNDGFLLLSGDPLTYDGRTNASTNNLDTIPKSISFTTGASVSPFRVWLIIGYKNSARGRELWVSGITMSTGTS